MKLFVALALVAFTGCHAHILSEEPKPQLDIVKDAFWDYFSKTAKTAQDTLKAITESELAQQLNTKITDSVEAARQYTNILHDQASIWGRELYDKVSTKVDRLSEFVQEDFKKVKDQLEPYTEKLWTNFEEQAKKVRQEVAPYIESLPTETLKTTFFQMRENLIMNLEWAGTELQTYLGPSTRELQETLEQRLQEFQQTVSPLANSVIAEVSEGAHNLEMSLRPYVDDLNEKLDPYTKGITSRLTSLWEPLTQGV